MKQGSWKSRKLFVAVAALVAEIVVAFGVSPEIADIVSKAIMAIAGTYIVGQSWAAGQAAKH